MLVTCTTGPLIEDLVVQYSNWVTTNMAGTALPSTVTALPLSGAALPLTPSTIQSIVVPLSVQDTPSICWVVFYAAHLHAAGHSSGPAAGSLISMPHAPMQPVTMQPTAMQPTAMPLLATPSIMSVKTIYGNQMGYLTGAFSTFNTQGTQFP